MAKYPASYHELLRKAAVPSVHTRWQRSLATEVFKAVKGISPSYIQTLFKQKNVPYLLLLLQAFPAYHRRVAGVVNFFHFLRSCVSSRTAPMFSISSLMLSLHLLLGLPLFRFPGSAMCSVLNPTWSPPLLSMCPYHLPYTLRNKTILLQPKCTTKHIKLDYLPRCKTMEYLITTYTKY